MRVHAGGVFQKFKEYGYWADCNRRKWREGGFETEEEAWASVKKHEVKTLDDSR